jgi:hypothetical protein
MSAQQLTHMGFKVIITFIGLGNLFHLRDLNYGQDLHVKYQRETNTLLEEIKSTQLTLARIR